MPPLTGSDGVRFHGQSGHGASARQRRRLTQSGHSARLSPLTNPALFVTGEGLSTAEVRAPNRAQISAAAACPPVLTQPRVEQDPVA
jgi:hypothetical protein